MTQTWVTAEDIDEARARFERDLGWVRPVLHGIGFAPTTTGGQDSDGEPVAGDGKPVVTEVDGEIQFVRVNERAHVLPAAVLATVVGWHGSTGSVRLDRDQLAAAIELLAPAEARREVEHPNLRIWRDVHRWGWDGGALIAVFDADPDAPTDDPYVRALREVVASGRQAVPAGEVRSWPPPGTDGHPLQARWDAQWPGVPPISHDLRGLGDHWVRFHTLPEAKRHPDTDDEYATVLHRHNALLDELRGEVSELQVITLELAGTPVPRRRTPLLAELLPEAECWSVLSWPHLEPELFFAHAYVNHIAWQPGWLDQLLREVADDKAAYVIVAPTDLSWLYAPYDGGADVLLRTAAARDELRERHSDWLSGQIAAAR
ncbi:DUF3885 domain-containing protein [Plantactinospora soyae]|uniref:DUF3885 domain-containing protein n=1 Tax=Plantactinospora soyae TaxID=1544732 RepID=A0A927M4Y3_9ACTN|nr:hypothetical protein [Plantactinospora soyae]MBE1487047.1 hypothetical protein [Plantactinospora soyae]